MSQISLTCLLTLLVTALPCVLLNAEGAGGCGGCGGGFGAGAGFGGSIGFGNDGFPTIDSPLWSIRGHTRHGRFAMPRPFSIEQLLLDPFDIPHAPPRPRPRPPIIPRADKDYRDSAPVASFRPELMTDSQSEEQKLISPTYTLAKKLDLAKAYSALIRRLQKEFEGLQMAEPALEDNSKRLHVISHWLSSNYVADKHKYFWRVHIILEPNRIQETHWDYSVDLDIGKLPLSESERPDMIDWTKGLSTKNSPELSSRMGITLRRTKHATPATSTDPIGTSIASRPTAVQVETMTLAAAVRLIYEICRDVLLIGSDRH